MSQGMRTRTTLRDFAGREKRQPMSFADFSDAVVAAVCILGFVILSGVL